MKKRIIKLWSALFFLCIILTGCSKGESIGKNETTLNVESTVRQTTSDSLFPEISYEIIRDVRKDSSGQELIYAEYPAFSVSGDNYQALSIAIENINKEWKEQSTNFLDSTEAFAKDYQAIDATYQFGQVTEATVTRCDREVVCIVISSTVEEGGPHPNNYTNTYNLNAETGEAIQLSDIVTIDKELAGTIENQLYENYPEIDFSNIQMEQEILDALNNNRINWYYWEEQICIEFIEGSFGFGHAEGSLGVLISK